jgi:hypothetical protein
MLCANSSQDRQSCLGSLWLSTPAPLGLGHSCNCAYSSYDTPPSQADTPPQGLSIHSTQYTVRPILHFCVRLQLAANIPSHDTTWYAKIWRHTWSSMSRDSSPPVQPCQYMSLAEHPRHWHTARLRLEMATDTRKGRDPQRWLSHWVACVCTSQSCEQRKLSDRLTASAALATCKLASESDGLSTPHSSDYDDTVSYRVQPCGFQSWPCSSTLLRPPPKTVLFTSVSGISVAVSTRDYTVLISELRTRRDAEGSGHETIPKSA